MSLWAPRLTHAPARRRRPARPGHQIARLAVVAGARHPRRPAPCPRAPAPGRATALRPGRAPRAAGRGGRAARSVEAMGLSWHSPLTADVSRRRRQRSRVQATSPAPGAPRRARDEPVDQPAEVVEQRVPLRLRATDRPGRLVLECPAATRARAGGRSGSRARRGRRIVERRVDRAAIRSSRRLRASVEPGRTSSDHAASPPRRRGRRAGRAAPAGRRDRRRPGQASYAGVVLGRRRARASPGAAPRAARRGSPLLGLERRAYRSSPILETGTRGATEGSVSPAGSSPTGRGRGAGRRRARSAP